MKNPDNKFEVFVFVVGLLCAVASGIALPYILGMHWYTFGAAILMSGIIRCIVDLIITRKLQ